MRNYKAHKIDESNKQEQICEIFRQSLLRYNVETFSKNHEQGSENELSAKNYTADNSVALA
jgi:hypothetical protein